MTRQTLADGSADIGRRTLDQMLAAHEAERCDCATCDQVRALVAEMGRE